MSVGYATFTDTLTIRGVANAKYQTFTITYELDGGTNPANAVYNFTIIDNIPLPVPTKTNFRFLGWYKYPDFSGTKVTTTDGLSGDTTLYAKWKAVPISYEEYRYDGSITFTGNNYLDTDMYLYTEENAHRNFYLSFNIESIDPTNTYRNTMMSDMDETHDPFNGFNIKIDQSKNAYLNTNSNTNDKGDVILPSTTHNVQIIRIQDKLYFSFDGENFRFINDYTGFNDYFDVQLTFGASIDEFGEIYRYFKGTLSDIYVAFIDDSATVDDFNTPKEELETVYTFDGPYVFDGTNYINTGLCLFSSSEQCQKDFELSFTIDDIANGNNNQNSLVNLKLESGAYPGFVYRMYLAGTIKLEGKGGTGKGVSNTWNQLLNQRVTILRRDSVVYLKINDGEEKLAYDYTNFSNYFNVPLTIGASLDGSGNPFRYFKGTLSDIVIKVEP